MTATSQPDLLEVHDQLGREINLAHGLICAIRGLAADAGDCAEEYAGAIELAEVHIERLQAIGTALEQLSRVEARREPGKRTAAADLPDQA